jgi:predicted Zn-dependent protease
MSDDRMNADDAADDRVAKLADLFRKHGPRPPVHPYLQALVVAAAAETGDAAAAAELVAEWVKDDPDPAVQQSLAEIAFGPLAAAVLIEEGDEPDPDDPGMWRPSSRE